MICAPERREGGGKTVPPALATSTSLRAARALPRSFLLLKKRNRYRPVAPYLTGTSFSKRTVRQIPREIASRPNRTDPNVRTYERVSLPRPHDRPPPFQCTVSPVLPVTARCRFTLLLASNAPLSRSRSANPTGGR